MHSRLHTMQELTVYNSFNVNGLLGFQVGPLNQMSPYMGTCSNIVNAEIPIYGLT